MTEFSAWASETGARRAAELDASGLTSAGGIVVATLRPTGRLNRLCDRCDEFVPLGMLIHLGGYYARGDVLLVWNLCTSCAGQEVTHHVL